ncbi:hypothetical protein HC251_18320 [Iamia sp. SCSIO 61187]|uniref:hypothetical protein n=1 Tax=Iamia sp. SCSIO 61187 TaxID=2722752 RepID=UPI001C62A0A3|nr:hypothetical protein [Iamia sp. SCSIO 61187]QYG94197.1 hypothetical protein HC251_18320 [Iamia sp. SCSIO 61187]
MSPEEQRLRLADGLATIGEHVTTLASDASTSDLGPRGGFVLEMVATEEAGKFLSLLDAARCLSRPHSEQVDQLKRCTDHVAKGIYARVVDIRPADLRELTAYVDLLRRAYYLDGPNDDDWIFRNEIESAREEQMYVDLVESDDGIGWWSPKRFDVVGRSTGPSAAVELVGALVRLGVGTTAGIDATVTHWESLEPDLGPTDEQLFEGLEGLPREEQARLIRARNTSTQWKEIADRVQATLGELDAAGLAGKASERDRHLVLECWGFPLYAVDVHKPNWKAASADLERLRAVQGTSRGVTVQPINIKGDD